MILIVDSIPQRLGPAQAALTIAGYQVATARNGEEALLKTKEDPPDLVILSATSARMAGSEVCTRLKGDEDTRHIPVIILSTEETREQRARAFEAGADDFLHWQLTADELLARVRVLIRERHSKDDMVILENAILALANAAEAKDPYSEGHMRRVAAYALGLAEEVGLSEREKSLIHKAAMIHDVGKIGGSDSILLKGGTLSPKEFEHVRGHCLIGENICKPLGDKLILDVVRHHHERYDGKGYPDGLKGEEITLAARVMAIADSFDAITHDRPYRRRSTREEALGILRDEMGGQFDPAPALSFISIIESGRFHGERSLGV